MQYIKQFLVNQKIYLISLFALIVVIGGSVVVLNSQQNPNDNVNPVLGAKTESPTASPTPILSPTPTLVPTVTTKAKVIIPTKIPTPTPTSSPSNPSAGSGQATSPTATPTPVPSTNNNPTDTPAPTPTSTPTPTPTAEQVTVKAGADTWTTTLNSGETAFDVVKRAVGDGLTYDTYECCGAFITGFHGEHAVYPQWWEFFINGASSSVGVSGYNPANGDVLEFVYHE